MSYQFCRINLSQVTYTVDSNWRYLTNLDGNTIDQLISIYHQYCRYRKFESVMPMFPSRLLDPMADVIGYWDQDQLVAWSLVRRFDQHNALCDQFAWTYHQPRARLGIQSLKNECAIYRDRGFQYLYLEQAQSYKSQIQGFELLGSI